MIPPIYGLQRVGFETYTGDGPISYWNSYVGVSQMGGHGKFIDPRIGLFINQSPDLVTPKLGAAVRVSDEFAHTETCRRERGSTGCVPRRTTVLHQSPMC